MNNHNERPEKKGSVEERYFAAVETARKGDFETARQVFEDILEEDPRHIESWGQLAYFHELNDSPEKALECYKKILEIEPGFALARLKLANCYLSLGDRHKARREFLSLKGTEFENLEDVQKKLALTEFLPRRVLRRGIPLLVTAVRRCLEARFTGALAREILSIPRDFGTIRSVGLSSYLSYLSQHYLQGTWYRFPRDPCDLCGGNRFETIFFYRYRKIVKCSQCGLEFVERKPPEGMDVLTDHYSRDQTIEGFEGLGWRDENLQQDRLERLQNLFAESGAAFPHQGARVLEIGFGEGYFLKKLQDLGLEVSGVETSDRLVEYARGHFGMKVFKGTVRTLPVENEKYDLVIAYHVLEHLDRPSELFRKSLEILKPGGFLFVEVPVAELASMPIGKKTDESIGYANLHHLHFFTRVTLPKYFEKYGFDLVGSYIQYPETHPTGGFLGKLRPQVVRPTSVKG